MEELYRTWSPNNNVTIQYDVTVNDDGSATITPDELNEWQRRYIQALQPEEGS